MTRLVASSRLDRQEGEEPWFTLSQKSQGIKSVSDAPRALSSRVMTWVVIGGTQPATTPQHVHR